MKVSYEVNFNDLNKNNNNACYVRLNLANSQELPDFVNLKNLNLVPILFCSSHENLINVYKKALNYLCEHNYKNIVIAIDNDGALQQALSPRYNKKVLEERLLVLEQILANSPIDLISVILTVEELIPAGLDPFDGIAIAKKLEFLGVKKIFATCGTKDFLLLSERKKTCKKITGPDLEICEPKIACALWLQEHTDLILGLKLSSMDSVYDNYVINICKKLNIKELIL